MLFELLERTPDFTDPQVETKIVMPYFDPEDYDLVMRKGGTKFLREILVELLSEGKDG